MGTEAAYLVVDGLSGPLHFQDDEKGVPLRRRPPPPPPYPNERDRPREGLLHGRTGCRVASGTLALAQPIHSVPCSVQDRAAAVSIEVRPSIPSNKKIEDRIFPPTNFGFLFRNQMELSGALWSCAMTRAKAGTSSRQRCQPVDHDQT